MNESYLGIFVLSVVGLLNCGLILAASHVVGARLAGTRRPTAAKAGPYESGMVPIGDTRERFSVKFYIVAILFIVFDIETIFLIPWAVIYRQLGLFGFLEMLVFILILVAGLVYAWKKGALEWN